MSTKPLICERRGSGATVAPTALPVRPHLADRAMLTWFGATFITSAVLVFAVQPMVGKMILPLLGGTPAAWNTCLVFFQAALLGGYAYAHLGIRLLGVRRQAAVHIAMLMLASVGLPVVVANTAPRAGADPALWLAVQLICGVGLPFVIVSSTAPMLQRWFSVTGHPDAHDPYFLYAASNIGSIVGLVGYPLFFERLWPLGEQSQLWSWGYGLLGLMLAGCAACVWNRHAPSATRPGPAARVTLRQRLLWIAAAAVPSSLMLGMTLHVTTNLAAVPLLWVLPLLVYLVTFILVFAQRPPVAHAWIGRWMPMAVIGLGAFFSMSVAGAEWLIVPAHLVLLFFAAMLCHGTLAATRPDTSCLTEFYLWVSIGGVVGGLFNAFVAPVIFERIIEYPLMMVIACLFLPCAGRSRNWGDLAWPAAVAAVSAGMVWVTWRLGTTGPAAVLLLYAPAGMLCFSFKDRPLRFAVAYGVILTAMAVHADRTQGSTLYGMRDFFGVKRVIMAEGGAHRTLYHGTTLHGAQCVDPARAQEPLTYYHVNGPLGDVFREAGAIDRFGVIGLGAGAIAAYAQPGQAVDFYEIDPGVIAIASDERYFTYLSACRGTVTLYEGDGRLQLAQQRSRPYDLLVLDAFSSDAIPVHLLTVEAFALYTSRVQHDGIIACHVSNRYLDLEPLLGRLAASAGLGCVAQAELEVTARNVEQTAAQWVVMSADDTVLEALVGAGWHRVSPDPQAPLWTDQYSNVLQLLK